MIYRKRGSGLGFFLGMLFVSAILGGLIVLLGLKYTGLGAAMLPQSISQQQPPATQLLKGQQAPVISPEQMQPAKALEQATINVVRSVGPAVVMITTREEVVSPGFGFFSSSTREVGGLGSGVIFDNRGYILTNNHVIASQGGTVEIAVILSDGRSFSGEVVGADPVTDVAVVKIKGSGLPIARLGNSDRVQVGQLAIAIGNPLGPSLQNTVTTGVISAIGRTVQVENHVMHGLMQTDASINPGNSGGPLLNSNGEVIGINTLVAQTAQGIGFTIPINTAREVAEQLIATGRVARPALGIESWLLAEDGMAWLTNRSGAKVPVDSGALISAVTGGSGAAAAGLKPFDLIVQVGGQKITSDFDLPGFVAGHKVGERLSVVYYRLEQGALGREWRKHTVKVRLSVTS